MQKQLLIFLWAFAAPLLTAAQTDVLIVEKRGKNMLQYFPGSEIIFKTVYDQWFYGVVTAVRNDSMVLANGLSFHYKEIAAVKRQRRKLQYQRNGALLLLGSGGNLLLGLVNGAYFGGNERSRRYLFTNLATSGVMAATGLFLLKSEYKTYRFGRRYQFTYLNMQKR